MMFESGAYACGSNEAGKAGRGRLQNNYENQLAGI